MQRNQGANQTAEKIFRQHISNLSCVKVMSVLSIKGVFYLANVSLSTLSEKTRAANICRIAIVQLCCGILAFSTARTVVFENYSPFGVAFLCAVPGEYSLVSIIGCIVGSILRTGGDSVRYITACIFALALKWVFTELFKPARRSIVVSLCAFFAVTATGCAAVVLSGSGLDKVMIYFSEGVLAFGGTYFLHLGTEAVLQNKSAVRSQRETTSAIIALSILLISLSPFEIFGISPARAAAVTLIIFAGYYGHEGAGAVFGLSAGLSLCLVDQDNVYAAVGFAFGGLMSGVFGRLSKASCAIAFILANGIVILRDLSDPSSFVILYEVLVGSVLFFVLPKNISAKFLEYLSPKATVTVADGAKDTAVMRLRFASEALENVSDTVTAVSEKLSAITTPEFEKVFSKTEQDCCKRCGLRIYCWEQNRGKTLEALLIAAKSLKVRRSISCSELPEDFVQKCAHTDRLLDCLSENFSDFLSRCAAERRLSEVRSVISEQFDGLSHMLSGLADEFSQSENFLPDTAEAIDSALRSMGLNVDGVCCREDIYGRTTAEIRIINTEQGRISTSAVLKALNRVCKKDFDVPSITELEQSVMLTLSEKAEYSVDLGVCQLNCNDNRLCGDAVTTFSDGKGRFYMLISDGMGCGGRAAVDGAMASGLMSRLLKAGFGIDCSLKIVNSAMLFKSTDESLATMDITEIDLFSGNGRFFKAGAPLTVVRRRGKALKVESETIPAGILKNVEFSKSDVSLSPKDIVIMMSDGAVADGSDWIEVEAEVWKDGSAQDLAEHIADYARRRCPPGQSDDITVMAAIIERAI